jgi:hypothetical protein
MQDEYLTVFHAYLIFFVFDTSLDDLLKPLFKHM